MSEYAIMKTKIDKLKEMNIEESEWDYFTDKSVDIMYRRFIYYANKNLERCGGIYYSQNDNDTFNTLSIKQIRITKSDMLSLDISLSSKSIAKMMHKIYGYKFACSSIKNNTWYEFYEHRWKAIDSGNKLKDIISDQLLNIYFRLCSICYYCASFNSGLDYAPDHDIFIEKANI